MTRLALEKFPVAVLADIHAASSNATEPHKPSGFMIPYNCLSQIFQQRAPFVSVGLVKRTATGLEVTDSGRRFIRNIAMCFDNTLAPVGERRHSKTI